MDELCFIVREENHSSMRLDKFLAKMQDQFTRSGLERIFEAGMVSLNGMAAVKSAKLQVGDKIVIRTQALISASSLIPQNLPLDILYEDDDLAVINKRQGMVVHPSSFEETETLVNALLYRFGDHLSGIGGNLRPGIVHRIDKNTSGLLVVAKSDGAHRGIAEQAEKHTMLRQYTGVVRGSLKKDEGTIDAPIGRHPAHRTKNCVLAGGRRAVTRYRVLQRYDGYTLVEFLLETGRTHQIRVHMAHVGHPIAGDSLYGISLKTLNGQCLHAKTLGFVHPITDQELVFTSSLPCYFKEFIKKIEDGKGAKFT